MTHRDAHAESLVTGCPQQCSNQGFLPFDPVVFPKMDFP